MLAGEGEGGGGAGGGGGGGIVSGRHPIGADAGRLFDEVMKLDVVITKDARARRFASQICLDERRHDRVLEILFKIENVVRNSELCGYTSSVPEIVQGTASAVIAPKLHRETDDLFSA